MSRYTALSLGERVARDGVFTSRRGSGEGLLVQIGTTCIPRLNRFPYFAHELLWSFLHQPVRHPQQGYAETP